MTYPLDTVMQPGIKNLWLIYGEKLTGLREDPYLFTGIPDNVPEPDIISRETVTDKFNKEKYKLPMYRSVNKA